jgi:transposase-like protein
MILRSEAPSISLRTIAIVLCCNIAVVREMRFEKEPDEGRAMRDQAIYQSGDHIERLDPLTYHVKSQTGNGAYKVAKRDGVWGCSCPDHEYRHAKCKHIWAVEFSLALRDEVQSQVVIKPLDLTTCIFCGSDSVMKHGLRHNKNGAIQRFTCKMCGKRFARNLGFEKLKATPHVVTCALQLYFTGESLRNVQRMLRLQGVNVSHQTVYNWIKRYVALMEKYLDKITPQVSPVWRADELYLKVKGNMKYLFAIMDDETRFWIAQEVADSKYTHDVRQLFSLARAVAHKTPKLLITDGLPAYHDAYLKEYRTNSIEKTTHHIHQITLTGKHNNNKMERLNGEVRDREKVMRGLKKVETPIISGYQIYHNYLRPHEALEGKTPADACGIDVQGDNKWITLIQNASRKKTPNVPYHRP